jgi:hypothetical protein
MPARKRKKPRRPRVADEIMAGMRELESMMDQVKIPNPGKETFGDLLIKSLTEVHDSLRGKRTKIIVKTIEIPPKTF